MLMTRNRHWGVVFAAALLAITGTGTSRASLIVGGPPTLERLVRASSVICQGEVVSAESRWVQRRVETTYTIRADRYLRGSGASEFDMTVFGGAVEEPLPVAMIFDHMVVLSPGQDVVLFLEEPADTPVARALSARAPATAASVSLRPVNGELGVFTVLTDPADGSQHITQLNYSGHGAVITRQVNDRVLQEAQSRLGEQGGAPALGEADKIELLELARQEMEEERQDRQELSVLTGDGTVVPIPVPDLPEPAAPRAASRDAQEEPSASLGPLRTLDDFVGEVQDIMAEEVQ